MAELSNAVTELRLRLRAAGYSPVPINGKRPPMGEWQTKHEVTDDEITIWSSDYRYAASTGILTRQMPVFDIDILSEEAAETVEALVRERFEGSGCILVRIGRAPKRAIVFRTNDPFKKITTNLIAPNGSDGEKLELLADGQQLVAYGIHVDTGKPYRWFGGEPGEVERKDLPCIHEAEAQQLIADAVDLLVRDFGYQRAPERPRANGADADAAGAADWGYLAENIRAGRALHDSLRDLGAKLIASGMGAGAAVNFLRGLMDKAETPHDERWKARYVDIPRLVESAETKRDNQLKPSAKPCTLAEAHTVFRRWLGDDYDIATLDAVLAVAAAERLTGDPAWLLIISGPGNAKTETVQAMSGLGAHVVSTISSEGALLSASGRGQRTRAATGGLLRQVGAQGVLVIKDMTSILSLHREARSTILAALREVHDGYWVRNVGTDGGAKLEWRGRIIIAGACTTAWDQAHTVISVMGDRFVLIRSDSHKNRITGGLRAMRNTGKESEMREELAAAAAGVMGNIDTAAMHALSEDDESRIVAAANIVTLARTGVETDYRGDVIDVHAPEMPTRFGKQLVMIMRGAVAIGMARAEALRLVIRCARDSMPPLRLAVLRDVAANPDAPVIEVRRRLQKPRATIDRALQALHVLGLLTCREEEEQRSDNKIYHRHYTLADDVKLGVLDNPVDGQELPVFRGGGQYQKCRTR